MSDEVGFEPRRSVAHRLRLPIVSGKMSAALLALCFGFTSVLIVPLIGKFPPWIDFEILMAAWWIVWVITLSYMLYSGSQVSDDHSLGSPRNWLGFLKSDKKAPAPTRSTSTDGWDWAWLGLNLGVDIEGCAVVLIGILALILAFVGLWVLLEIVIPTLAFIAYFMIRGMLAKVTNDIHNCEGSVPRSVGWASVWATVYTAPVALIVYLAHVLHAVQVSS